MVGVVDVGNMISMRCFRSVVVGFLIAAAGLVHGGSGADDKVLAAVAPGLWSLERIVVPTGLPMPPKPRHAEICVSPSKGLSVLNLTALKTDDIYDLNCKVAGVDKTASADETHWKVALSCTPDLARKATLDVTIKGSKKVSAVMTLYKDAEQPWLTYQDESNWQGPCPK